MSNYKQILILGFGALIGSVATYFVCKKQFEQELDEMWAERVNEDRIPVKYRGVPYPSVDDEEFAYQQNIDRYAGNDENVSNEEPLDNDDNVSSPPYIIDQQTFIEDIDEYEKLSLTYYANENILLDDHQEIVSNSNDLIGADGLSSFGIHDSDPDTIYIRNERLGIDFEVIRILLPYTPQKPKRRRRLNAIE